MADSTTDMTRPATLDVFFDLIRDPRDVDHIVISPETFVIQAGGIITFHGNRPFTLRFLQDNPVEGVVELRGAKTGGSYQVTANIRGDAARLRFFKYSLAMLGNDGTTVHLLDPGGVVEPDPRKKTG